VEKKKKLVVLSGAGISAESGLRTFRDAGGLWENYDIREVATYEAWQKNPKLVLEFYNDRRKQVIAAMPNAAHSALVSLEQSFDVHIITQNIDDLHERSGSSKVLHLHGEILKSRSVNDDIQTYPIHNDLQLGDLAQDGHQLRPHVVWFGEAVPAMDEAIKIVRDCDILIVVGTSLNVYPAAGLAYACHGGVNKFIVDPENIPLEKKGFIHYKGSSTRQIPILVSKLLKNSTS
jgi:NAD-dependent deacetylase